MPKARVIKGGWSWLGEVRNAGDVLDAPSAEWIQNRVNDGGLVEPIDEAFETADVAPAETAVSVPLPSQRASAKQRTK